MSLNRNMVASGIAERVQAGCSPPLRRRRTREYIPNSRSRQRAVNEHNLHDMNLFGDEDFTFGIRDSSAPLYQEENMNSFATRGPSSSDRQLQLQDILRVVPDDSHLSERYQILKAENKILRERLQNALQRELKALKTFKRLAKENRQLKLNLRKYERTLLGFYDDESDSDQSELHKETEFSGVPKEQATGKETKRKPKELANSHEYLDDQPWQQNSPTVKSTTRSTSTSTEDISRKFTEDKSTSTDELESIELKSQSKMPPSTLSDAENHKDAESEHGVNLTDANKVQMLHNQLMAIQNQSVRERRKFSETRRYWTDPTKANNLGVNELQRALSSPSLFDGCRESSSDSGASSVPRRRSSEGSSPRSPGFISRSRPPSFHDAELTTVPEVTISHVTDSNGDSSRSCSPSSGHSQEELGLNSPSPVPSLSNGENVISQSSPRASPLTLTSVFNSRQTDVFPELDPSPSPQTSPAASPRMSRRKFGHTVSLPTASFHRYLQENQTENRVAIIAEDLRKRPLRQTRRKSIDDDEIYVKKNRQTSVSLRFEGNIERENAETLAADIAEFLESRHSRNRVDTMPIDSLKESKKETDIPEENATASAQSRSFRPRRGSAVVSLPGDHYKMDLHVLNVLEGSVESKNQLSVIREKKELSGSSISLNSIDPEKRSRWSILRRNKKLLLLKDKQEKLRQGEDFREVLARMKENPRPTVEHELSEYKNSHWTQLMGNGVKQNPRRPLSEGVTPLSDHETKRREAVWELFHSEVVYLTSHLLVLKEVFLEPLQEIHQMGHLQYVDAYKIFCNLQDLCEVSTKFAKNLLLVFKCEKPTQFGSTAAVVSAFTEFSWRVHPQYQKYCLNYSKALSYLDSLKKYEDFQEFTKCCEADIRCNRLQLTDLLVAPLQHLTKYPLLLKNIRKRTSEGDDQHSSLSFIIKSVELSIQELEGKVKSRANYERLQELQSTLVWPPITELDPKTYIPEFLKGILSKQPCESLLASPKRQLLYEGPLTLIENAKMDVYAFLFDDMLLLTKSRKFAQKATKKLSLSGIGADSPPTTPPAVRRTMSGIQYSVYKQPIPLDRFIIIDAEATPAGSTLKNTFIIIHYSRFKQTIGLYTLQAPSQNLKETWTSTLKAAQSKWSEAVALELAAETENLNSIHTINETPAEQEAVPESPDDTAMTQTQMLSYYKPIESQC